MAVLIDTSFLLAVTLSSDPKHIVARKALADLKGKRVLPVPVLPELFYMVAIRADYKTAVDMFNYIQNAAFEIESLTPDDRTRMSEIMGKYLDTELDFVDMAIMAISERLNIRQVCTFDRRDFAIFRPQHCPYLELLPQT